MRDHAKCLYFNLRRLCLYIEHKLSRSYFEQAELETLYEQYVFHLRDLRLCLLCCVLPLRLRSTNSAEASR